MMWWPSDEWSFVDQNHHSAKVSFDMSDLTGHVNVYVRTWCCMYNSSELYYFHTEKDSNIIVNFWYEDGHGNTRIIKAAKGEFNYKEVPYNVTEAYRQGKLQYQIPQEVLGNDENVIRNGKPDQRYFEPLYLNSLAREQKPLQW